MLASFLSSDFIGATEGFLLVGRVCGCMAEDDIVARGEAGGGGNDSEVA